MTKSNTISVTDMKPNWISLQWLQMYASHSSTCEAPLDTYFQEFLYRTVPLQLVTTHSQDLLTLQLICARICLISLFKSRYYLKISAVKLLASIWVIILQIWGK